MPQQPFGVLQSGDQPQYLGSTANGGLAVPACPTVHEPRSQVVAEDSLVDLLSGCLSCHAMAVLRDAVAMLNTMKASLFPNTTLD